LSSSAVPLVLRAAGPAYCWCRVLPVLRPEVGDLAVPTGFTLPVEAFQTKTKAWAGRPRFVSVTTPQPNGRMKSIAVRGAARDPWPGGPCPP